MNLCERCEKGRKDICKYFLAEFLESEAGNITSCPEFMEEQEDEQGEDLWDADGIYPEDENSPEEEAQAQEAGEGAEGDRGQLTVDS